MDYSINIVIPDGFQSTLLINDAAMRTFSGIRRYNGVLAANGTSIILPLLLQSPNTSTNVSSTIVGYPIFRDAICGTFHTSACWDSLPRQKHGSHPLHGDVARRRIRQGILASGRSWFKTQQQLCLLKPLRQWRYMHRPDGNWASDVRLCSWLERFHLCLQWVHDVSFKIWYSVVTVTYCVTFKSWLKFLMHVVICIRYSCVNLCFELYGNMFQMWTTALELYVQTEEPVWMVSIRTHATVLSALLEQIACQVMHWNIT